MLLATIFRFIFFNMFSLVLNPSKIIGDVIKSEITFYTSRNEIIFDFKFGLVCVMFNLPDARKFTLRIQQTKKNQMLRDLACKCLF